ncbi:MAG: site-specific integrase, partial [Arcobacter sp.]|nr:site-specific integrase [Arcobacter sp.]
MKKQEILERFEKQLTIENYANQTIKSYLSAIKLFLEYISKLEIDQITEKEIQNYLYYCKDKKKYSFSAMKQVIASIRYLYIKVLHKPIPESLFIKLKKPNTLPSVLSAKEISKILQVTKNLKHKTILFLIYSSGLR